MNSQVIKDVEAYADIVKRNLNDPQSYTEVNARCQQLSFDIERVHAGSEQSVAMHLELTKYVSFIFALNSYKRMQLRAEKGVPILGKQN